jgi:hypothetical protein
MPQPVVKKVMMKKSPALLDCCCGLVVFVAAGVVVVQAVSVSEQFRGTLWIKESTETLLYI